MSKRPAPFARHAFSLVEMLVVISIVGIIAAVAIPSLGSIHHSSKITATQRRAQDITAVFTAGKVAGAPSFLAAQSVEEALNAVGTGDFGIVGGNSVRFSISGVSPHQDDGLPFEYQCEYYLHWSDGNMQFDRNGGHLN